MPAAFPHIPALLYDANRTPTPMEGPMTQPDMPEYAEPPVFQPPVESPPPGAYPEVGLMHPGAVYPGAGYPGTGLGVGGGSCRS